LIAARNVFIVVASEQCGDEQGEEQRAHGGKLALLSRKLFHH
jgi:hypothetical protein